MLEHALALADLASKPAQWIIFLINNTLLHWNDRVIGNANMFGANFGTALGDVTHSKAVLFLSALLAIAQGIERVHIEFCDTDKETWSSK